ncbi:TonB-dependent receptor [Duganella levis]|uniref:TonB-dependent receptor n=1 Tax=Duganella levis TaxID=2692169 RepID=A0ABW9VT93_9BURK|nr:TonB-dependent receptor [Duganella levis]MYN24836.1 TonB-dependent receptor [Duganella levis]
MAAMPAARAQEGLPPEAEIQSIVVSGFHAAERATVQSKKATRQIMDAVSQDDIGQLPDFNIVEAARRIPGLSVVGGGDATKNRDIYQRATIRGLDSRYNLVTVDGVPIASADQTYRGARLEMLPAGLVSQIQAIKTVTAEYDPHALGGQVNLVSRSAFAMNQDRFFVANAFAGRNSTAGKFLSDAKTSGRADATGAAIFGDRRQFGVVVSAELQRLPSSAFSELPGDTSGAGWTYYTAAGARTPFKNLSVDGKIAPVRSQDFAFDNLRERASLNSKLEYRFGERSHLSAFAGYYADKDTETRYETLTSPGTPPASVGASGGHFASGDVQQGFTYQPVKRRTNLLTLDGLFEMGASSELGVTASSSKATYREYRQMIKYDTNPKAGSATAQYLPSLAYSYAVSGGIPRVTFDNPMAATDPALYKGMYWRDIDRDLDNKVDFLRADYKHNFKPGDRGFGFNAGVNLTKTTQSWDVRFKESVPRDVAAQQAIGSLSPVLIPSSFATYETPQAPYLLPDRLLASQLTSTLASSFVATNQLANNYADDYTDTEKVKAGYIQGIYQTDRWTALAGLREDRTDVHVEGYDAPTTAGSAAYTRSSRNGDYRFLLPSLLVTFQADGDQRFKGGISKTIGRPDFAQYAARKTFSIGTDGGLTVNQGNPNLAPREAWNYDLSYEWYLRSGGLVSAALFYKDISNEIFTASAVGAATDYLGKTYSQVTISQPLNAAKAGLKGVELQYVADRFTFLPRALRGIGFSANLTWLKGFFNQPMSAAAIANGSPVSRRSPGLIHQPDFIANATLSYAAGPLDVRLSFNRIGRALESVDQDTSERDLYAMARNQVDLQGSYQISRSLRAVIQGQNLNKAPFIVRQGVHRELLNNYFPVGRTVFVGLTYEADL